MIDFAFAADGSQTNMLMQFAPMLLILVVFYFLIMCPQKKKLNDHQALIAGLKKGDRVVLASGFSGRITKAGDEFFTIEIANGVEVEVERNAVSRKIT